MIAVGAGGFTGSSAAEGPTAGYDPLMKFQRRGKTDYRKVPKTYKQWVKSLDSKNVRKTNGS
ncbi:major head protein [Synechococcus phage S-SCSM1]|uniref:Virion protein n=1 Tax=Synechococcus phage S-SCSM1 TaxID=2588487 RepID=A0A6M2ZHK1_9CAUD|nr:major head protein [Synechococcus phage S-SCSM1]QFG06354.1 virion protein [Synechococcus phage S-SCSM1]